MFSRLLWPLCLSAVLAACSAKPTCANLDDANPCTDDTCSNGVARHTPSTIASACATGVCDGQGTCVQCLDDTNCPSGRCSLSTHLCASNASCTDGQRNGTETGVDCGGACAPGHQCTTGGGCTVGTDCQSGVCTQNVCVAGSCGDGVQQPTEACDDGNKSNDDGCDDGVGGTCRPTGCGNGTRAGTEGCDDGNAINGDGCDNNCNVTRCGNGIVAGTETCDDGNTVGSDGCSAGCRVEPGYTCTMMPSSCISTCGNGTITTGEECDDGNRTGGDGCSMNCFQETGFACTGSPSTCASSCGDGIAVGAETCDDRNTVAGDGCSATCQAESGYVCAGLPSSCVTRCGDGLKVGAEACDDGNINALDGCATNCTVELGWTCTGSPSVCGGLCGDGVRQGVEACDDRNLISGDGCSATCTVEAGYACAGIPSACTAVCGDGIKGGTEGCDDGALVGGDGCSATCTVEPGYACAGTMPSVCSVRCGDGARAAAEGCDDGNVANGDGCSATCAPESGFACTGTTPSVCRGVCGDGVIVFGEACDDANATSGNGCSSTCTVEFAFACSGMPSVCTTTCGDGLKASTEACDDGNVTSGNGCSATCTVEVGWSCSGTMPSTCVMRAQACGDGFVDGSEQCDDGNTRALDGCGANCRLERTEIEPNEDGATITGGSGILGNDFASANANTNGAVLASLGNTAIVAALTPAGDEDVFAITNDTLLPQVLRLDTWNRATGYGQGVACATSIDLGLNLRDAAGTVLLSNDDRNLSADRCSGLTYTLAAGQTVYAHVVEYGDDAAVPGYGLEIGFTAIVCGNGIVTAPEECDDGNQVNTDQCTNLCRFNAVDEVEQNGTRALADASTVQVTGTTTLRGTLSTATDLDLFRVTVASSGVLRFETFTTPGDCDASTTTTLRVFDGAGTQVATDNTTGIASCSALVINVAAGTYYVQVEETGLNAVVARYFLEVAFQSAAGNEVEPDETIATASATLISQVNAWGSGDHTTLTDVDVWAVTVPPGKGLRAEVIEGGGTTCESLTLDSRLTLYNAAGTQLVEDDDSGRGFCSMIDGTGSVPAYSAAKNSGTTSVTWYLMVRASSFASGTNGQFRYALQVTVR